MQQTSMPVCVGIAPLNTRHKQWAENTLPTVMACMLLLAAYLLPGPVLLLLPPPGNVAVPLLPPVLDPSDVPLFS